jgi:hypothetical protein
MQRILLSVALVAISSAAFAQGMGPARSGGKCWIAVDGRGFGYWRGCEYHSEVLQNMSGKAVTVVTRQPPITHVAPVDFSGGGGADGGGASGGGGSAGGGK